MSIDTKGLGGPDRLSRPRRLGAVVLTWALASELVPTQAMVQALAVEQGPAAGLAATSTETDEGTSLAPETDSTTDATEDAVDGAVSSVEDADETLPSDDAQNAGEGTETAPTDDSESAALIDLSASDIAFSVSVEGGAVQPYTGAPIEPAVEAIGLTLPNGETRSLELGRDYVLGAEPAFTNNTNVTAEGATLTIVGKGAYTGVATIPGVFAVAPLNLSELSASQVSLARDSFEYGTIPAELDARLALGDVELASGEGAALVARKLTSDANVVAGGSYGIVVTPAAGNANLTGSLVVEDAYTVTARSFDIGDIYCMPTDDESFDVDGLRHVFDDLCVRFDENGETALSVADGGLTLAFYDVTNDKENPMRLSESPCTDGSYLMIIGSRSKNYTVEPDGGIVMGFRIAITDHGKFEVPVAAETNLVYNGTQQHAKLGKGCVWGYGWNVVPGGMFGSAVEATNAGTYSFTVALADSTNTTWADGSTTNKAVSWTIDPLNISNKKVEMCSGAEGGEVSYVTGTPAKATYVSVDDDLIEAGNFDIVYTGNEGATEGTTRRAHASIAGKLANGNVVGTASVSFDIAKASLAGATLALGNVVSDADGVSRREATLTLADGTVVDASEYDVLYTKVDGPAGSVTATLPTAVGSYAVSVQAHGNGNYKDGQLVEVLDAGGVAAATLTIA